MDRVVGEELRNQTQMDDDPRRLLLPGRAEPQLNPSEIEDLERIMEERIIEGGKTPKKKKKKKKTRKKTRKKKKKRKKHN